MSYAVINACPQNPAFGPAQIRGLTPIFIEKSLEVCSMYSTRFASHGVMMTTIIVA